MRLYNQIIRDGSKEDGEVIGKWYSHLEEGETPPKNRGKLFSPDSTYEFLAVGDIGYCMSGHTRLRRTK